MALSPGQTLQQRYHVAALLGQGGMSAVYRAWDSRLNVPVALKEMVPQPGLDHHALEQLRRQFQQEATTLARLHHPNLVRVTDFFEEGGNAYLVMGFVEGDSLASRIARGGALPEALVLTWADQLLDALGYCHASGAIHRDVKPQNVIISPEGQAVLVDFGLVKLWNSSDPRTRTAMRGMGTPEYAPPEQYDAQTAHTDARSDIYGLGATLYHALTGRVPPTATQRVVNPSALQPIRSANPSASAPIEAVLMRAMELRPIDRFNGAAAMREALHANRTTGRPGGKLAPPAVHSGGTRVPAGAASEHRRGAAVSKFGGLGIVLLVVGLILIGSLTAGAIFVFNQRTSGQQPDETPTATAEPTPSIGATVSPSVTHPTQPPVSTSTSGPVSTATRTATRTATPSPIEASTSTPTSAATPAPSPTTLPPSPTPTPLCPAVSGPFAGLWQELQSRLGCAANQANGTWMAEQTFEDGRVFWRKDRDSIYVVYDSGTWAAYPNNWNDGDPIYSCPATAPEASPPTPLRGFGRVWCSFDEVRNGLGWATDGERGYDAMAQDFDAGWVFRNDFGVIFVLFDDGTWEQR